MKKSIIAYIKFPDGSTKLLDRQLYNKSSAKTVFELTQRMIRMQKEADTNYNTCWGTYPLANERRVQQDQIQLDGNQLVLCMSDNP